MTDPKALAAAEPSRRVDAPPTDVPVVDCDPYGDAFLMDPYPVHERLREAGPVAWIPEYGVYAVARYDDVRKVLMDHHSYISSAGNGLANFRKETPFRPLGPLIESDPPEHTAARNVVSRVMSPRALNQLKTDLENDAAALVDRFLDMAAGAPSIDAMATLCSVYPLKVFPDAVGVESAGRENLLPYGDLVFNSFGPRNERFHKAFLRVQPLHEWVMKHCDRDRLRPGGLGDQIYQGADAGEITLAWISTRGSWANRGACC
ncbi:cytochrome P450 [Variovorax sp. HW608]|uniref:cytochrome P450 n=1 Tax=Variovorax sp. HW608 TaxID=1034889 RepID=UPI000B5ACC62|nr:cytochrome P450 [Variovorax sp. HW608]